jgi:hypothetical protein
MGKKINEASTMGLRAGHRSAGNYQNNKKTHLTIAFYSSRRAQTRGG